MARLNGDLNRLKLFSRNNFRKAPPQAVSIPKLLKFDPIKIKGATFNHELHLVRSCNQAHRLKFIFNPPFAIGSDFMTDAID